jgi:predicted nucleic acid-binding protein
MAIKARRYWDSVCVFGFLHDQAGRKSECERVLKDCDAGGSEVVMSALTLAEVLHLKGVKRDFPREMKETIRLFFKDPRFLVVDVDRFIAENAQDIFWQHNIMPKDAIHIATALASNAHFLETFDEPLIAKSRQLGGDPQLVVHTPGADLFTKDADKEAKGMLELPLQGPLSS